MASLANPADDAAQRSAEALEFDVTEESAGRRRVLDAAAALFVAQGYAATTLRQIAAAAGIKAGSIYHHFDSKETIFVTVLADGMTVMRDAFETVHARTAGFDDAADRLRAHVRAHLGAVFEHGPYTTATSRRSSRHRTRCGPPPSSTETPMSINGRCCSTGCCPTSLPTSASSTGCCCSVP